MSASSTGAMRATLGLDMSQFETRARAAGKVAGSMAEGMSRSFDQVRQSVAGQSRSFDELRASIDPTFAAQQRYAALQREVSGMVARGAASQRAANLVLEQAASKYMGVETAAQTAARAQRESVTATDAAMRSYSALRASLDPVFAATKSYESAQEQLTLAVKAGAISQAEANRVLAMAANSYLAPVGPLNQAVAAQRAAGAGASRMGPAFVNAGFQVQDFAVQVAGGQSALLAFAQQLPQLLGVLGFAGRLAMIGAGLGVVAAVGGAVAMSFMRASDASKTMDTRVSELNQSLSDYDAYVDIAVMGAAELAKKFGSGSEAARRFYAELAAIQGLSVAGKIADLNEQVEKMVGLGRGGNGYDVTDFFGLGSGYAAVAKYSDEIEQLRKLIDGLSTAKGIEEQYQASQNLLATFRQLVELDGKILPNEQAVLDLLQEQAAAIGRQYEIQQKLNGASPREVEILQNKVDLWRAAIGAAEKQTAAVNGQLAAYQQQADLQNAIAKYGETSAEVEAVKRDQAIATADAFITQHGLAGQTAQGIRDGALAAYDAQVNVTNAANALRDAEAAAKGLAGAMAAAAGFSANLDDGVVVLEAKLNALKNQQDANNAGTIAGMRLRAAATRDAALAEGGLSVVAQARYGTDMAVIDQQEKLLAQIEATTKANSAAASAGKSAASASAKQAKQMEKEAEKWRDLIDPMNKYRRQQAELDELLQSGALTSGEVQQALAAINREIAEADPLLKTFAGAAESAVDYMLGGFKDGFKGLFDIAKDTLKQVIAMFAKNRILLSFGMGGTVGGVAGAAAAAGAVPGAASGGMGSLGILGSLGGIGSAFMSGMGLSGSAFMSGGIGSMFSAIGAQAGTALATGTMTSVAATVGAIALPVAAVAAAFSFFKTKTKLLDEGIKVTVDNLDTLVYSFKKVEKSKFWGLSKSTSTSWDVSGSDLSDPIVKIVHDLQMGVLDAASALDVGRKAFRGFTASVEFSTKGLSQDEVMETLQEKILELGDSFARLAFGDLSYLIKEGEGATEALSRLVASMQTVNGIMDTLGHSFRAAGLAGAGMAAELADLFGGLDAMTSATSAYYQAFYSEQERNATAARQAAAALKELGVAMPRTRDQYRAMIESMDLTTDAGRQAYAALVGMSGVFDQILPQLGSFTAKIATMVETLTVDIDKMIGNLSDLQKQSLDAAKAWYNTARTLREFVSKMRGVASAFISPGQARANSEARYQILLARAAAGDAEASAQLTGAADALIESAKATAGSALDVARVQARVLADIGNVASVADVEGKRHEIVAGLLGNQVDVLKSIRDLINSGLPLDPAELKKLTDQLGTLSAETVRAMGGSVSLPMLEIKDAFKALPLGDLRGSLVDLRKAVVAETARANAKEAKQAAIDKAQALLSRVAADQQKAAERVKNAVGAVNTFDSNTGGNLVGKDGNAVQAYVDANGKAVLNAAGVKGASGASLDLWRSTFWRDGGLEDQMYAANKAVADANRALEEARKAVRQAGGIPAFASGGTHAGGLRLVGERGPELEATGPSRIYSADKTRSMLGGDNAEMVAELRALRAEVARMRNENTQLALRIESNTYKSATVLVRDERRTLAEG